MDEIKKERLSRSVEAFVQNAGGIATGIATVETLAGGPPSADLSYVLPGARSAVVFALPLDQEAIERYLAKKDFKSSNIDNRRVNSMASGIALELAVYLRMKGHAAVPVSSNFFYREDAPLGRLEEQPDISHRYLAVRSGIGHFGLSGNVIRKPEGAAIILGSTVTTADLIPTDPLPAEDNYCDRCKLCQASCASGFMSDEEDATVTLGGVNFTYAKRRAHERCDYVCGGFTGLHRSGRWSTWSPARFPIPDNDEDFGPALMAAAGPYIARPKSGVGFFHAMMPRDRGEFTCGHCQYICHPDVPVRKRRYRMIVKSGVVIQREDGALDAVSPDQAKAHIASLSPELRALYE
ncbi:MAG: epoxyqueuosine reductase [Proteobacteria bacterium]|nr:epoxyqueuosine reductase [Pseudomonadota bacterium]